MITLLDIAKANGSDAVVGLIEEATKRHPELTIVPSRTIVGLSFKTLVRTGLPTVVFRDANQGTDPTKSAYENRVFETHILSPRIFADKAVADRYENGKDAYIAMEAIGHVEAAMQHLAACFYYGTATDAKAYPGLLQVYDSTNMDVDAEGSSASTGSSVWGLKLGVQDVTWLWGANGSLEFGEVSERDAEDADGKKFNAYFTELLAYPGLQIGNRFAIGRIRDLTEDSGKGLTDALLAKLLEKFQNHYGANPDVLLMSPRSLRQLRVSRTAYSPTGAPADVPKDFDGVPIHWTNAIKNTETLT